MLTSTWTSRKKMNLANVNEILFSFQKTKISGTQHAANDGGDEESEDTLTEGVGTFKILLTSFVLFFFFYECATLKQSSLPVHGPTNAIFLSFHFLISLFTLYIDKKKIILRPP